MKKIIFIGQVENGKVLSGPGQVLYNIFNVIKKEHYNVDFINTYCLSKRSKIKKCLEIIYTIATNKGSFINVHSFGYFFPFLVCCCSFFNKKNIYFLTLHGIVSVEKRITIHKSPSLKEKFLEFFLISYFDNIIVVSNYLKKYLEMNYERTKNVFVIRNGVNFIENDTSNLNESNVITFIDGGGISDRKGTLETCLLIKQLHDLGLNVELIIFGKIVNRETYKNFLNFIEINSAKSYIKYKGVVSHEGLLMQMRNAKYCISLSKFDTFNLTILEALSVGTPVIVSEKAGVSELIRNESGLVVNGVDNLEKICEYINVNQDQYLYRQYSAKELSKKYSWRNIGNEYITLFKRIPMEHEN